MTICFLLLIPLVLCYAAGAETFGIEYAITFNIKLYLSRSNIITQGNDVNADDEIVDDDGMLLDALVVVGRTTTPLFVLLWLVDSTLTSGIASPW